MSDFVLSQVLATLAFACGLKSFQCQSRRFILLWMCGSALLNAFHFLLLDRIGPGTLYVIMAVRIVTAVFTTDRRLMYLYLLLILGGFTLSYERPLDVLAGIGASLATVGNFQASVRLVRLIYMACACIWIVHNTFAGTPVAVVMEASFLVSNVVGYWRHHTRGGSCQAHPVSREHPSRRTT